MLKVRSILKIEHMLIRNLWKQIFLQKKTEKVSRFQIQPMFYKQPQVGKTVNLAKIKASPLKCLNANGWLCKHIGCKMDQISMQQ